LLTTQKRDLRTGKPLWALSPAPRVPRETLTRDLRTEVLIVGAGISGAFMAEALSQGHRVAVIDRRGVAKGSTAASTALIASEIDVPLSRLSRKIGREAAVRAWQRAALAVRAIETRTDYLGVAGLSRLVARRSLYVAGDLLDSEGLREEGEARRAAGLDAEYLSGSSLRERFGIHRSAGLLSFGDLAADPIRLAGCYLRVAIQRGAKLFAPVEATGIETGRTGITVTTPHASITAEHVVFCTGYEVPKFLSLRGASIASTYAYATRPQTRRLWPTRCLIWEASDPYIYLRDTPDGRVLCGGEDEELDDADARDALIPAKMKALQRKVAALVPKLDAKPEIVWAGSFGGTKTGLPLIGAVPGHKGCWAVLGFGGNGTTYSRIAADIIRSELAGRRDADADLFTLRN
jgi:glycine/D-amino acid oxidase-like deaminating enzyme